MPKAVTPKVRKYSIDYLRLGFIQANHDETRPFCLLCKKTLANGSMKPSTLSAHLNTLHAEYSSKPVKFFEELKAKEEKGRPKSIEKLFSLRCQNLDNGLEASYQLSSLIAKCGQPHSVGERLVKPALSIFARTALQHKSDSAVDTIPLSNDSVRRRIDEMASDVEQQLVTKLREKMFTVQLDESTVRNSEALLMAYVRFIDNGEFVEEMLFCEQLTTTTTAADIYDVYKNYMSRCNIPLENVSCAADDAPAMMGKRNGVLKLMKDDNPKMMLVHCVIHRENLVARNLSPELNDTMTAVIKCVNLIKAQPKAERLFKVFCEDMEESHVKLLLHCEVRWLSKGNCLARFHELYDSIMEFLGDAEQAMILNNDRARAGVAYITDIFGKLNALNQELQGLNKTLLDAKMKIFGFVDKLKQMRREVSRRELSRLTRLDSCDPSDEVLSTITGHIDKMIKDFSQRFQDLADMEFPVWLTQYSLADIDEVDIEFQDELSDLRHDASVSAIYCARRQQMWFHPEVIEKYPRLASCAQNLLLPFPSSYLVECGFSAVTEILSKKRGSLDITRRGDL